MLTLKLRLESLNHHLLIFRSELLRQGRLARLLRAVLAMGVEVGKVTKPQSVEAEARVPEAGMIVGVVGRVTGPGLAVAFEGRAVVSAEGDVELRWRE